MMEENEAVPRTFSCDVVGEVDFGEGPVRVRCTQRGHHIQHRSEVYIRPKSPDIEVPVVSHRHNVFETYESD